MDFSSLLFIAAIAWFIFFCLPQLNDSFKPNKKKDKVKRHHQPQWNDEVSEGDRVLLETIDILVFKLSDAGRKRFNGRFTNHD